MKHRCQSQAQNELWCFSQVYNYHESAPVGQQDQCLMKILPTLFFPIFFISKHAFVCHCPIRVSECMRSLFHHSWTYAGIYWHLGEGSSHPEGRFLACLHGLWSLHTCKCSPMQMVKTEYRYFLIVILYLLRQTAWLSLRRAHACGGGTANLCG